VRSYQRRISPLFKLSVFTKPLIYLSAILVFNNLLPIRLSIPNSPKMACILFHFMWLTLKLPRTRRLKSELFYIEKRFKVTLDGDLHNLLIIKITRDTTKRTISLSSPDKITNLLKAYHMFDAHHVPTPMISTPLSSRILLFLDLQLGIRCNLSPIVSV
jgi:hypothetical protein